MSVGCKSEKVAEGGREETGELLFGEEFEDGGLGRIDRAEEGWDELHGYEGRAK